MKECIRIRTFTAMLAPGSYLSVKSEAVVNMEELSPASLKANESLICHKRGL